MPQEHQDKPMSMDDDFFQVELSYLFTDCLSMDWDQTIAFKRWLRTQIPATDNTTLMEGWTDVILEGMMSTRFQVMARPFKKKGHTDEGGLSVFIRARHDDALYIFKVTDYDRLKELMSDESA